MVSPTGAITYVASTAHADKPGRSERSEHLTVDAYQTTTRKLIRSIGVFPRLANPDYPGLTADLSGRYVLHAARTRRARKRPGALATAGMP